jgi:site-specific recombinase XerD
MANNYHDEVIKENQLKMREILQELPKFCTSFFRGIEETTSSRTRIAYAYDLRIFFYFLEENNPICKQYTMRNLPLELLDQLTPADIEDYMEYLRYYEKDGKEYINDERGIMRKLSSLRSFYNYYYRNEMITNNPPALVKLPKLHEKAIVRLDVDEVANLLDMVEQGENLTKAQKTFHNKTKTRDLALLTLLLGTGIRVSECVGLDLQDVDFKNSGIKIRRKGGYEAVVYFGEEVNDALIEYLKEREHITPAEGHENALFLSLQKKRLQVRSVEKLVKKYTSLVTSLKKITPHKLRSTYGTSLYRETGDIYLVADVLGHKDVNTTKRHYAAIEEDRRRSARNAVTLREKSEHPLDSYPSINDATQEDAQGDTTSSPNHSTESQDNAQK